MLSVSAQSAQFKNPVYINFSHVVALGCQTVHLKNMVLSVYAQSAPFPNQAHKIVVMWFLLVAQQFICLICCALRVCPNCPIPKSSIYELWSCSCSWMPLISSVKFGVLSVSAQSAKFPNPIYVNCGHVVALGCPTVHLRNLVCFACLPKVPNSQI